MSLARLARHALIPDWWALRVFPKAALRRIGQAISVSESRHGGELRVVIEGNLPLAEVLRGQTSRQRALGLFARLGVWDTEHNCIVLIYLQLIDRQVEIVADRGINAKVGAEFWGAVCARLETALGEGRYEQGLLQALDEITDVLSWNYPAARDNPDELPNTPLLR